MVAEKKRGPAPTGKGEPIVVRMQPHLLALLNGWIGKQKPPFPSRPEAVRRFIAAHRGRIESSYNTLKDQLALESHRAHTFWGLLTRVMGKLAAYTLRAVWRYAGLTVE